jgi:hypothetical protein
MSGITRNQFLLAMALLLVVLTCANLWFAAIQYELGLPYVSILTGPGGPTDRFADLVKISFSYRTFTSGIEAKTIESWPDIFRSHYHSLVYGGKEALAAGRLAHFHIPPLMTVLFIAGASLTAYTKTVFLTFCLFYLLYFASVEWAIRVGIPREQRAASVLLLTWFFALVSYPALLVFIKGNFHAGWTSMLIMAFMLSLFVRKQVGFAALISLAIAVNIRPNAVIFAVALPLVLGLKPSIKPILRFAALAVGILAVSLFTANRLYPDYTLRAFMQGLDIYKRLYVIGSMGDAFNSSLWALIKNLNPMSADFNQIALCGALSVMMLLAVLWGVRQRANWIIVAPFCLLALYAQFLICTHNSRYTFLVFSVFSVFLVGAVSWGLWRSPNRVIISPFILTALYCLLCPVFGDYHLLVFLTPILLVFCNYSEWTANFRLMSVVSLASILMLAPKNYIFEGTLSWQTILNPLILCFATLYLVREAISKPKIEEGPIIRAYPPQFPTEVSSGQHARMK